MDASSAVDEGAVDETGAAPTGGNPAGTERTVSTTRGSRSPVRPRPPEAPDRSESGAPAGARRGGVGTRLFRHPRTAPLAVLGAGVVGAAYLYTTDPHEAGHWLPTCPLRAVTGVLCPACGATRMVYDLLHGDLLAAWHDNRLLLLASPLALWLLARWGLEGLNGRWWRPRWSSRSVALLLGTAVTWMVVRNLC